MSKAACGILLSVLMLGGAAEAKQIGAYQANGRDYIKCTCTDSQGGYTTSCYSHSTCDGCCGAHGTGGVSAPLGVAGPFPDRPCKEPPVGLPVRERAATPVDARPVGAKPAATTEAGKKQVVPARPTGG